MLWLLAGWLWGCASVLLFVLLHGRLIAWLAKRPEPRLLLEFTPAPDGCFKETESVFNKGNSSYGVLLLHGFSASVAEFVHLMPVLRQAGITFYAPRLPGFGCSNISGLLSANSTQWVNTALEAYDVLSKEAPVIYIVGHSMGGLLALITAAKRKTPLVILTAPYLQVKSGHVKYARLFTSPLLYRLFFFFRPFIYKAGKNPEKYVARRFTYDTVPLYAINQLWQLCGMLSLAEVSAENVYLLSGALDNTVENHRNAALLREGKFVLHQLEFPKSGHNLLEDREYEQAVKNIVQLLNR